MNQKLCIQILDVLRNSASINPIIIGKLSPIVPSWLKEALPGTSWYTSKWHDDDQIPIASTKVVVSLGLARYDIFEDQQYYGYLALSGNYTPDYPEELTNMDQLQEWLNGQLPELQDTPKPEN